MEQLTGYHFLRRLPLKISFEETNRNKFSHHYCGSRRNRKQYVVMTQELPVLCLHQAFVLKLQGSL